LPKPLNPDEKREGEGVEETEKLNTNTRNTDFKWGIKKWRNLTSGPYWDRDSDRC